MACVAKKAVMVTQRMRSMKKKMVPRACWKRKEKLQPLRRIWTPPVPL